MSEGYILEACCCTVINHTWNARQAEMQSVDVLVGATQKRRKEASLVLVRKLVPSDSSYDKHSTSLQVHGVALPAALKNSSM